MVFFSAGFSGAIGAPVAPVDSLPPGAIAPVPPSGAGGAAGAGGGGGGGSSFLPQPANARVKVKRATIDHEVIRFPIFFTSFPQIKSMLDCNFYYITDEYLQEVSLITEQAGFGQIEVINAFAEIIAASGYHAGIPVAEINLMKTEVENLFFRVIFLDAVHLS